ncbi:MAG: hypothetical protein EOP48_20730, partial [Sphingobacteriales bacterium]
MFFKFLLLLTFLSLAARAQEDLLIKEVLDGIVDDLPEDFDFSELSERLIFLKKHPINLNRTKAEELKSIFILSPLQIANFFTYLSVHGKLIDVLELQAIRVRGVLLLYVYVPQSSKVHRCNGIVFDRQHESDIKIIDEPSISQIYTRKSGLFTELRIYPFLKPSAFKPGIIERIRTLIRNNRSNHPWLVLSDEEFLVTAGLYRTDFATGEEGYTLAAALLLGRDEVIKSILPHFRIDSLVRRYDLDRYDDRLDVRTNLIDAY